MTGCASARSECALEVLEHPRWGELDIETQFVEGVEVGVEFETGPGRECEEACNVCVA